MRTGIIAFGMDGERSAISDVDVVRETDDGMDLVHLDEADHVDELAEPSDGDESESIVLAGFVYSGLGLWQAINDPEPVPVYSVRWNTATGEWTTVDEGTVDPHGTVDQVTD